MYNYVREYKTARAVYAWLEFVGWATVVLGLILVLAGFATGGIPGMMYEQRDLPFGLRLLAALPGIGTAIAGLFAVAYAQTSRAHVDTAETSREMLEIARKGQMGAAAPGAQVQISEAWSAPIKGYDARKWEVLKEVDAEISGTASRIAALDARLEAELAEKYLILNDKTYLVNLERLLAEKFAAERQKSQALMDSGGKNHADSSRKEMAHYNELLSANGQKDPYENVKVVKVEPYFGKWEAARGGIKVTLENGQFLLIKGWFRRPFDSESQT